jgi:glycerol-3-phosphate cytidylyltransferase
MRALRPQFVKHRKHRGYTTGVFDVFHIGHLNLLRNAAALCDELIVGVTIDELVKYKHKSAIIPFEERLQIVGSCKYVSLAIPQSNLDKYEAWKKIKFDSLFVGDDWYENPNWKDLEFKLKEHKVKIVYLPYTSGTSSTLINETLENLRKAK